MTEPAVFYKQEDVWVRPTEKHHGAIKPLQRRRRIHRLPEQLRDLLVEMNAEAPDGI